MNRLRKNLALAALLTLALPSCVIALGNRGSSPHPHEDCPICSEKMEGDHASATGHLHVPGAESAVLVGDEPALAARR